MLSKVVIFSGLLQILTPLCVFAATPQSASGRSIQLAFNEKRSDRPSSVYTRVPDDVVPRMEIRDPGENAQVISFRKTLESSLTPTAAKVLQSLYEADIRNLDVDLHTKDWGRNPSDPESVVIPIGFDSHLAKSVLGYAIQGTLVMKADLEVIIQKGQIAGIKITNVRVTPVTSYTVFNNYTFLDPLTRKEFAQQISAKALELLLSATPRFFSWLQTNKITWNGMPSDI